MSPGNPPAIRFGEFTLNVEKGMVYRGGVPLTLRPKVFTLLRHLADNAGRVVSKDELLDVVWPRVTVTEDSLTQLIKELRKNLDDGKALLIRTIPRRGYLLDTDSTPPDDAGPLPRVAVMRFEEIEREVGRRALVDGIAEDILDGLCLFRSVTVIAPSSSFSISVEERADPRSVGARLGVDFLVEGSVAASDGHCDISVRLIEVWSGRQLWRERYTASGVKLFQVQNDIAAQIVNRLVARIDDAQRTKSGRKSAPDLEAYELFLKGVALLRGYGPDVNQQALKSFEAAMEKDGSYGLAYAYLGLTKLIIANYALAPPSILAEVVDLTTKAVSLDPEEARCHRILGLVKLMMREFEAAEQQLRRAHQLNPGDADTIMQLGYLQVLRGKPIEGLSWMKRALRLNPIHPQWYHLDHAVALYFAGDYSGAAAEMQRLPLLKPWNHAFIGASKAMCGDIAGARISMALARSIDPMFDPQSDVLLGWFLERNAEQQHLLAGIRLASPDLSTQPIAEVD